MNRPEFSDLDAFVTIVRHRNFRRAARERGVSASTLSQSVRDLEERLGVRLLNRTTRSVTPTDAGERLAARLSPIFSEMTEALDEVNGFRDTPTGTLRLNVPGAAQPILAPLVARFLGQHPGIRLEITVDNNFVDVFAEGFDAGIRYDESLALDMIALPIGRPQRYALVASPELARRQGLPQHPKELLTRPCIRHRFHSGAVLPWEFEKDGETVKLDPDALLVTTSPDIAIRAAEDGVGWYATFEDFVRPALAAGRLVEALTSWCPSFPGPSLYYPSRRHVPAPLRAFIDFVRGEAI
ncbi:LysR family transcriptional regulator [Taklimakanibacter lacteus]|uniref:LysR family transcriptional regulator n=1 Tax=Taklimakanibacter lacteus TaxID=2268456 RepID=UPI000E665F96